MAGAEAQAQVAARARLLLPQEACDVAELLEVVEPFDSCAALLEAESDIERTVAAADATLTAVAKVLDSRTGGSDRPTSVVRPFPTLQPGVAQTATAIASGRASVDATFSAVETAQAKWFTQTAIAGATRTAVSQATQSFVETKQANRLLTRTAVNAEVNATAWARATLQSLPPTPTLTPTVTPSPTVTPTPSLTPTPSEAQLALTAARESIEALTATAKESIDALTATALTELIDECHQLISKGGWGGRCDGVPSATATPRPILAVIATVAANPFLDADPTTFCAPLVADVDGTAVAGAENDGITDPDVQATVAPAYIHDLEQELIEDGYPQQCLRYVQ